jgi:hypothetical protein
MGVCCPHQQSNVKAPDQSDAVGPELRFGVDSRPGIEDTDRRSWLMPTP